MRPPNFWLTERRYTKDRLIRKMTKCRYQYRTELTQLPTYPVMTGRV